MLESMMRKIEEAKDDKEKLDAINELIWDSRLEMRDRIKRCVCKCRGEYATACETCDEKKEKDVLEIQIDYWTKKKKELQKKMK